MDDGQQRLIEELLARVTALENSASLSGEKPESGLRERLQKKRQEQVDKKAEERFKNGARPINAARRAELEKRTTANVPPVVPPAKNQTRVAVPPTTEPFQGGGKGKLTFNDCSGAELFVLEWDNGIITTNEEKVIEAGCSDGSSSGSGSGGSYS